MDFIIADSEDMDVSMRLSGALVSIYKPAVRERSKILLNKVANTLCAVPTDT